MSKFNVIVIDSIEEFDADIIQAGITIDEWMEEDFRETIESSDPYRSCMFVIHDNRVLERYWDGGEPEDQSFCRDLSWIEDELRRVYDLGYNDGINLPMNRNTEDRLGY